MPRSMAESTLTLRSFEYAFIMDPFFMWVRYLRKSLLLTPDEVSKLANRDKNGENYWLEPPQYDTKEFAER